MFVKKLAKKIIRTEKPILDIKQVQKLTIDTTDLKLIGFVKCYNEGQNGNLERCLNHLSTFCNDVVFCDDSSTDNSLEIARKFTDHIIQMPNDFKSELFHKQKLLELALSLNPDWIVWLDPDEIFDRIGELELRSLCKYGDEKRIDSFSFLFYNLWKNLQNYRVDELWNKNWQIKLWKNTGNLKFDIKEGMHLSQYPFGLNSSRKTTIKLIHYGFSTTEKIAQKYDLYKKHGQTGLLLERIKDETTLKIKKFSRDWFPLSTQKIVVVCLIYKSIGYLNFVLQSFTKYTKNADFLFVANDATSEVKKYLLEKNINHLIFENDDKSEHYIKRVYRAWNYSGMNAPADIIVFVNSDMVFSENWLDNLLKNLTETRVVTSRLIESGKLPSGKTAISKDFGRTYKEFDDMNFQKFVKQVQEKKLVKGGLFMPCAIYKENFVKSGGYPIGNRKEKSGKITSGDWIFFYEKLKPVGINHFTAYDSLVYHIQEGEMAD